MFYIIVLAMVAAFLALRLYSVLGKRTGHEQPLPKPAEDRVAPQPLPRAVEKVAEPREPVAKPFEGNAEPGIRAIVGAEQGFDVARFLDGAQAAYRMILEAFWRGDRATLDDLVSPDVARAFGDAIAAREAAGHTLDNRLVSIEKAVITGASLNGKDARITVRFDADIAAVTRNADGEVVAGSTSDAVETHDVWTFARTLRSADPNWKLSDTDEA
ncbi:Tim44/TimA family putative adaptor protein [Sphingomonas sp. TZW2008]|uniref:Tim44/TimA family putative adaptor protein n=1 Tax=Sphingomonas sp. TZW2008 TaxID=1917973 RepID=UPI001181C43C|nr:Tim44/TimA family putative adaptor protein [Sphingomonas sp. TZW2008]